MNDKKTDLEILIKYIGDLNDLNFDIQLKMFKRGIQLIIIWTTVLAILLAIFLK